MLNGKTVLITGGTGSFGQYFIQYLLKNYQLKKLIIFSRDEYKQHQMKEEMYDPAGPLRFFLGDVRDLSRLNQAFHGVDIVVHAAALKQVPAIEYNPFEAVKTNINGTQNVIEAAIAQGVGKVLLISSDKAVQPANLYGATKLCAEKLVINGNFYADGKTRLSAVRYGNVVGSRGSIVETMLRSGHIEKVKLTHPEMTRFWISLEKACKLVLFALDQMEGGEVFIPKIPSMKTIDLMAAIAPGIAPEIIGIRPGEKIHEILLTKDESRHTIDLGHYFAIMPEFSLAGRDYQKHRNQGLSLQEGFYFASNTNEQWMNLEQMKIVINQLRLEIRL